GRRRPDPGGHRLALLAADPPHVARRPTGKGRRQGPPVVRRPPRLDLLPHHPGSDRPGSLHPHPTLLTTPSPLAESRRAREPEFRYPESIGSPLAVAAVLPKSCNYDFRRAVRDPGHQGDGVRVAP